MSLIICPECGGKISDKAIFCPHCGYIISHEKTSTNNILDCIKQYDLFEASLGDCDEENEDYDDYEEDADDYDESETEDSDIQRCQLSLFSDIPYHKVENECRILMEYMDEGDLYRAEELIAGVICQRDADKEYELASLFEKARNAHHSIKHPNSPICQWHIEMINEPVEFWKEMAAEDGHIEAMISLTRSIVFNHNTTKMVGFSGHTIDVISVLEKIASDGNVVAMNDLGDIYSQVSIHNHPKVIENDFPKALFWYRQAAALGNDDAENRIYYLYQEMAEVGDITWEECYSFYEQKSQRSTDYELLFRIASRKLRNSKKAESIISKVLEQSDGSCICKIARELCCPENPFFNVSRSYELLHIALKEHPSNELIEQEIRKYKKTIFGKIYRKILD